MTEGGTHHRWRRRMLALAVLLCGPQARAAGPGCAPPGAAAEVILRLLDAAGHTVPRGSSVTRTLDALRSGGQIGPEVSALTRAALQDDRLPVTTYLRLVVDLANGAGPSPSAAQARQVLVRRGAVLPQGACVTVPDLHRLLSGERTELQDPYLTPAARTGP